MINTYYPISFLPIYPYNTEPITFNPEYIQNLEALNITDYFTPSQFVTNPLFSNVDNFHQNVGLLQTAINSLDNILTIVDDLKNINNPTQDIIKDFSDEINSIIKNTTFDNINVFNQTLNLNNQTIDLKIPMFNPNNYSIEEYEKLISEKRDNLFSTLQNLEFTLPFETSSFTSLFQNPLYIYNTQYITPQTLELLLS